MVSSVFVCAGVTGRRQPAAGGSACWWSRRSEERVREAVVAVVLRVLGRSVRPPAACPRGSWSVGAACAVPRALGAERLDVDVADQVVAQLVLAFCEPREELRPGGPCGCGDPAERPGGVAGARGNVPLAQRGTLADHDDGDCCPDRDPEQALHRLLLEARALAPRPDRARRTPYENAATLIIGEPTVAAKRDVSAETFSETCAADDVMASTRSICTLVEATAEAASSSTGTVWSVSALTETRASSSTRPSLTNGSARKPTSSTNAIAAMSPATSPTDMSRPSLIRGHGSPLPTLPGQRNAPCPPESARTGRCGSSSRSRQRA